MANLTFSNLVSEVFAHTGLDSSDSTNQTNVYRWLNYCQQDICARWPWPWILGRESIATIPDYTTGTVSITAGGTAVTGTLTVFSAVAGDGTYYIQFSTANNWYRVTARGGPAALTIETAYQQGTNATNVTYTLRKFFYALSTACDEVIDIRNWNTPVKLIQCDLRTIDFLNPLVQSTNAPYGYMMVGTNPTGVGVDDTLYISPYPFPTDARLLEIRTKKRPVDMVVSTQEVPSVPNKYAHVIAWGAIAVGFAYLRKFQEAAAWSQKYEERIAGMKKEYRQSEDYQPMLRSIDSFQRSRWQQMPDQYPMVS